MANCLLSNRIIEMECRALVPDANITIGYDQNSDKAGIHFTRGDEYACAQFSVNERTYSLNEFMRRIKSRLPEAWFPKPLTYRINFLTHDQVVDELCGG